MGVLAIILDIYNEVRSRVDTADTIFLFFRSIAKRTWLSKRWVSTEQLDQLLENMDGSTTVTKEQLYEIMPKLTHTQANMLFHACKNTEAFDLQQEMRRSTFLKLSAS